MLMEITVTKEDYEAAKAEMKNKTNTTTYDINMRLISKDTFFQVKSIDEMKKEKRKATT